MEDNEYCQFLQSGAGRGAGRGRGHSRPGQRTHPAHASASPSGSTIPESQPTPPPEANPGQVLSWDDMTLGQLLVSPGRQILPHLEPNPTGNAVWFCKNSVGKDVRKIIERDFKMCHTSWKYVTLEIKDRWYKQFAQKYYWNPAINGLVREEFEEKAKCRLNDQIGRWKKKWQKNPDPKVCMPSFFDPNIWAGLVAFWQLETTQEKSVQCSSARLTKVGGSDQPSKHCSGQISYAQRAVDIAVEKGDPATMPEVWEKTHRRPDGTWVDERVHKLHDDVIDRVEELSTQLTPDGQPTQMTPMEINRVASQMAPRTRKGKMAFTGSIRTDDQGVPFCPLSRFASDPQIAKELQETKQRLGETEKKLERTMTVYDNMFAELAKTNPVLGEIMSRRDDEGGTSTRDPVDDISFD